MKRNGFTLIELLTVIIIIAIIATIGIYSVVKVINKTRERALTNTALMVKKAVNTFLADSDTTLVWIENTARLDMTPGNGDDIEKGQYAYLIDLSKDPWGKDYESVLALILHDGDKYHIDVYLTVSTGDTYELAQEDDAVTKLKYELSPLIITNAASAGETVNITFGLHDMYGTPAVEYCKPYENNVEVSNPALYSCGTLTKHDGMYQLPVTINRSGTYRFKVGFKSVNEEVKYQYTDELVVSSSISIVMNSTFSAYQNVALSVPVTINNVFPLSTVKDEAGTVLIGTPVAGEARTFTRTYTTTGAKSEKVIATDTMGNTKTFNYTVNVIALPTISALTATPGANKVTLSGSTVTNGPLSIAKWQYRVNSGSWLDIASSASNTMPSVVASGLTTGTTYTFEVRALDSNNQTSNVRSITAAPSGYTVNFAAGVGGYFSGTATQSVASGGSATSVQAIPSAGYYFTYWFSSYGPTYPYPVLTVSNVLQNQTWTAYFAADGSCPFLYVWDGNKYQFESDLYPKGRLGGGKTRPQPNDFYILRNTPQIKDGFVEMKVTTELPESHYTDEMKLYAVDLPVGVDVVTQQQQTNIDYPTIKSALKTVSSTRKNPVSAKIVETGEDVTSRIIKSDRVYGILNPDRNDPKNQTIELDLGDLTGATNVKLITDAAAFTANSDAGRAKMVSTKPVIKVLNDAGEWVLVTGVIADKPGEYQREYVIDLTGKLIGNNYKVRITYTSSIYFDAIFVDTNPEVEVTLQPLTLASATLDYHGRNQENVVGYLYRYEYLTKGKNFISYLEGYYTKFGDVTPLLESTDDKYVITGSGDEITVRWQPLATAIPDGMERHYLVYTNGYYKYLLMPLEPTVAPLPFKAQSNFPYGVGEKYPDDSNHLDYLNFYNTRYQPNTTYKQKTVN